MVALLFSKKFNKSLKLKDSQLFYFKGKPYEILKKLVNE